MPWCAASGWTHAAISPGLPESIDSTIMFRALFKILKWLLVGTGAVAVLLVVFSMLWTRYGYQVAAKDTAVTGNSNEPCQFSVEVPVGFCAHDTRTGTNALLRTWNHEPPVYLHTQRWFKPHFPGDWFLAGGEYQCTIAPRAVVKGRGGVMIPTFFASRCQTPASAWEHFKNANVLYAQVPVGDEVDIIAFTSRSEKELMNLEAEFRYLVASHYAPPKGTGCPKRHVSSGSPVPASEARATSAAQAG